MREVATAEVKWISCGLAESGPIEIQFLRVSRKFTVDKREREMKIVKKSDGDGNNGRPVHIQTFTCTQISVTHIHRTSSCLVRMKYAL
jgi:hypothetical protein